MHTLIARAPGSAIAASFLFAFLLTHQTRPAYGQELGSISGVVFAEPTGEGLSEVNVYLVETGQGSATGLDGTFTIERVAPGRYTLVASRVGYQSEEEAITVTAGGTVRVELFITPEPIQLDEMLAQADRPFSAASSGVVRAFDLAVRPTRSSQDLLQLTPGLITAQHAGGGKAEQIFLRGFDADHGTDVNITVDGLPVNMVSHGHGQGYADLHFVIPDIVQNLSVHKGPYWAQFGNFSTAGSIAFTTRDHLEHNMIRLEGGAFETRSVTALFEVPLGTTHQGAYLASQFYNTDGPFESPQGFKRFNLFGKFHTHLSESARLAVSASGFSSAWDASGQIPIRAVKDGMIDRFGTIDDLEGGTTSRQDFNLQYEASRDGHHFLLQGFASFYTFKLFSNFTFFLEDQERGDMIEQTDERGIVGLNGQYAFNTALGGGVATTTLGGCFRSDNATVALWKSPYRVRLEPLVDSDVIERNLCLWVQEDLVPSTLVRVQLGLRADYFTFDVTDHLDGEPGAELPHASGYGQKALISPKLNVALSPTSTTDLFANFGTSFHSNDARSVVIGARIDQLAKTYERQGLSEAEIEARLREQRFDPDQRGAESLPRAVGAEIGVRTRVHPRVTAVAAGWWLDLEREYVYVGDGGFTELSGRSRRLGVDFEARIAITGWLSADADLNLSRGILRDEPENADAIPLAPRRTSTGGLTVLHPSGLEGSLRYVHVGERPANEDGSITAEGYTLVNLLAAYRFGDVRVQAALENVLDVEWNEAQFATESRLLGEPAPVDELHFTPGNPRNIRIGVSYLF